MRRCIICESTENLVDVRKVVGYNLDIDTMTLRYDRIEPPITYCEKHFMERVWNKPKPA